MLGESMEFRSVFVQTFAPLMLLCIALQLQLCTYGFTLEMWLYFNTLYKGNFGLAYDF